MSSVVLRAVLASNTGYAGIISSGTLSANSTTYVGLSPGASYFFEIKVASETDASDLVNRLTTATKSGDTYSFYPSTPSGWTLHGCQITSAGLSLTMDSTGNYSSECYADLSVAASQYSGQMVKLDASFVDSIYHGDFEGVTKSSVALYQPSNNVYLTARGTGAWYSNSAWPANRPNIAQDGAGNSYASIDYQAGSLLQHFKIVPGEDFRFSFWSDTTGLGSGRSMVMRLYFFDRNFKYLNFRNPETDLTHAGYMGNFRTQNSSTTAGTSTMLIRALDCDSHLKYQGGTGIYSSDIYFNQCQDSNGTSLTTQAGVTYSSSDVSYGALEFFISGGSAGTPKIDNVSVVYLKQMEWVLMDQAGNVMQRTAQGTDLIYVSTFTGNATLRVYLRTLRPDATPVIRSLGVIGSTRTLATVGTTQTAFTQSRLRGFILNAPSLDYENSAIDLRTQCVDPLTSSVMNCLDYGPTYNSYGTRQAFFKSYFSIATNTANTDYVFWLNSDGELFLKRTLEYMSKGHYINISLVKNGGFKYNDPNDGRNWEVTTEVDDLPDPTGVRTGLAQSQHLMGKYAQTLAALFNGTSHYTFRYIDIGRSTTVPKVTDWGIFNEENITGTTWAGTPAFGDISDSVAASTTALADAALHNRMGGAIRQVIPDANVAYNGMASHNGPMINLRDLSLFVPGLDRSTFTRNSLHPYWGGAGQENVEGMESFLKGRWNSTKEVLNPYGFDTYPVIFGEFGFSREIYDPACVYVSSRSVWQRGSGVNVEWTRGFGLGEQAKLMSRQVVAMLSLPSLEIRPYGAVSAANESWGMTVNSDGSGGYECWRSFNLVNWQIFDRVAGTGLLSGRDEPTRYQTNAAGTAYTILAKYLTTANAVSLTTNSYVAPGEYLNLDLFDTGGGRYVLAVSWYRQYTYTQSYMDYISGAKDEGFSQTRIYDIELNGLTAGSAKTVSLVDGSMKNLTIGAGSSGGALIRGVPASGLPVLVLINY